MDELSKTERLNQIPIKYHRMPRGMDILYSITYWFSVLSMMFGVYRLAFGFDFTMIDYMVLGLNSYVALTGRNKQSWVKALHSPQRKRYDAIAAEPETKPRSERIAELETEIARLDKLAESTTALAIEHKLAGLADSHAALTAAVAGNLADKSEAEEELAVLAAERDAEGAAERARQEEAAGRRKAEDEAQKRIFEEMDKRVRAQAIRAKTASETKRVRPPQKVKPAWEDLVNHDYLCTQCGAEGELMIREDTSGTGILHHKVCCWKCGRTRTWAQRRTDLGQKSARYEVKRFERKYQNTRFDEDGMCDRDAQRTRMIEGMRPATASDYRKWLSAYMNEGAARIDRQRASDFRKSDPFGNFYVVTEPDLVLYPMYGSSSMNIIVPKGIEVHMKLTSMGCLGHSDIYFYEPWPRKLSFHGKVDSGVEQFRDTEPIRRRLSNDDEWSRMLRRQQRTITEAISVPPVPLSSRWPIESHREIRRREIKEVNDFLSRLERKLREQDG